MMTMKANCFGLLKRWLPPPPQINSWGSTVACIIPWYINPVGAVACI